MKKLLAAMAAAGFAVAPAFAGELEDRCVAYVAEHGEEGADDSACGCIEANADADVTAELLAIELPEDEETISDAAQAVIDQCVEA